MAAASFSSTNSSHHPKEQAVTFTNLGPVGNSILFAVIGLLIYGGGFYLLDRITPYHLGRRSTKNRIQRSPSWSVRWPSVWR
jgi:hypothetical protein